MRRISLAWLCCLRTGGLRSRWTWGRRVAGSRCCDGWTGKATISLVHRFANAPREVDGALHWDLKMIEAGLDHGLHECAAIATEGVRSIAVDGWAVDYVRVDAEGRALADPFCYRDERTIKAERALHRKIGPERLRELTGIQLLRINTLYQLVRGCVAGAAGGAAVVEFAGVYSVAMGRGAGGRAYECDAYADGGAVPAAVVQGDIQRGAS